MIKNFTIQELRNTEEYRNAIMSSYRIYVDNNDKYIKFKVRKQQQETELSGEIYNLKQFREQLILFIQQLNKKTTQ